MQTVDNDLALKVYIKARATPKVVAAFAERREFDKILIYSKQVNLIIIITDPPSLSPSFFLLLLSPFVNLLFLCIIIRGAKFDIYLLPSVCYLHALIFVQVVPLKLCQS